MKFKFIRKAIHNLQCFHKNFHSEDNQNKNSYIYFKDDPCMRIPLNSIIHVRKDQFEFRTEIKINNHWNVYTHYKIQDFGKFIYVDIYKINYEATQPDIIYVLSWKLPSIFEKMYDYELYFDNKDMERKLAQSQFIYLMIDISLCNLSYKSLLDKLLSWWYK